MKHEDFNKLIEETVENVHSLSTLKGGEYAGDTDRLANFKRNATALGVHPFVIWAVYAGKHWDAVVQFVQDRSTGKTRPRAEEIAGRLDDLIVYAILMKALVLEYPENTPKF